MVRPLVGAVVLLLLVTFAPGVQASTFDCSVGPGGNTAPRPYSMTVDGQASPGRYAAPESDPIALVMVAHGWSGKGSWMDPEVKEFAEAGALAIALDFRPRAKHGYNIFTGEEDTAAAVAAVLAQCGDMPVILYGVSMGGHISAWTVMKNPGIADYLVADVAPANLPEHVLVSGPGALQDFLLRGTLRTHEQSFVPDPRPCRLSPNAYPPAGFDEAVDEGDAIRAVAIASGDCDVALVASTVILEGYGYDPLAVDPVSDDPAAYQPPPDLLEQLIATSPALNQDAWLDAGLTHAYLNYGLEDFLVPIDHGVQFLANLEKQGVPATLRVATHRGSPHNLDTNPTAGPSGLAAGFHYAMGQADVLAILGGLADEDATLLLGSPEEDLAWTGDATVDGLLVGAGNEANAALAPAGVRLGATRS